MTLHAQNKGKGGEREVARALNAIIVEAMQRHGLPMPGVDIVQRNQNQSAVGGNDLTNTFGVAIEIKRQESLSINTWWKQTVASAERNNEIPVLVYRQNRKPWHVVMNTLMPVPPTHIMPYGATVRVRSEVSWESFLQWFAQLVDTQLAAGHVPRV